MKDSVRLVIAHTPIAMRSWCALRTDTWLPSKDRTGPYAFDLRAGTAIGWRPSTNGYHALTKLCARDEFP